MNNEKMNQMINYVYKNYVIEDVKIIPNMSKELMTEFGYRLSKEEFINKCKTDLEFSERWGLRIEERELSESERLLIFLNEAESLTIPTTTEELDNYEIPTKLITITYNNETIEVYE